MKTIFKCFPNTLGKHFPCPQKKVTIIWTFAVGQLPLKIEIQSCTVRRYLRTSQWNLRSGRLFIIAFGCTRPRDPVRFRNLSESVWRCARDGLSPPLLSGEPVRRSHRFIWAITARSLPGKTNCLVLPSRCVVPYGNFRRPDEVK